MTVILVKKKSAWEQYHLNREDFGSIEDSSRTRLKESHDRHARSIDFVLQGLKDLAINPWVVEGSGTSFKAKPSDLVVTVGGDGTFLAASHNIGPQTHILGVNSDPVLSRGRFCSILQRPELARRAINKALTRPKITKVIRMEVLVDNCVVANRVLNEALFSHSNPAAMTRVAYGKIRYACSGLWIGTGAGSTGAIKSAGGKVRSVKARHLQTIVREPCGDEHKANFIGFERASFEFVSKISDATLYLDGPFLRVPVGFDQRMEFRVSEDYLSMVT